MKIWIFLTRLYAVSIQHLAVILFEPRGTTHIYYSKATFIGFNLFFSRIVVVYFVDFCHCLRVLECIVSCFTRALQGFPSQLCIQFSLWK